MSTPYLRFERDLAAEVGRKTQVWNVIATRHDYPLGVIKWFGRWRQYAFFPATDSVWNPECLDSVNEFVRMLMRQRRKAVPQ